MPRHVFLSYVRDNAVVVDQLVKDLAARGVPVWLDRERLIPGQRWRDVIREAIRSGDLFVACFSREYLDRDRSHMNEELIVAIEELRQRQANRSWFIPISLDGCSIPARNIGGGETIHDLQWVDLAADWDRGVALIAKALTLARAGIDEDGKPGDDADAVSVDDDEDAGLLDAGDRFLERMAAFGHARARIINAVVEFYRVVIVEGRLQMNTGLADVRDEMSWRAELLEKLVAQLRAEIPQMNAAFNAAMKSLVATMNVAGEVGLDNSMSSVGWEAAVAQAAKTIESDRECLVTMRNGVAGIGRFTTRLNRAKKAAVVEIDRLLDSYNHQKEGFARFRLKYPGKYVEAGRRGLERIIDELDVAFQPYVPRGAG